MDGRRLQEAGQLARGQDRLFGGPEEAGGEAAIEAPPPQREVGAEEGEAGDRQTKGPQVVALGQRTEGGEQTRHRRFCPPPSRRLAAQENLRLEQLAGLAQLRVDRLHRPAALDLFLWVGTSAAPLFAVQERRPVAALAVDAPGLASQPPPQASRAEAARRQEVDADARVLPT